MSYSVTFGGAKDQEGKEESFELCSGSAWSKFKEWVESLSEEDAPTLKEFAEQGTIKGTMGLAMDLMEVLEVSPPEDEVALAVAKTLAERCGVGDPEETVVLET